MNWEKRSSQVQAEEIAEITKWINQQLTHVTGYTGRVVTDLRMDLADGTTLIRLAQSITGQSLPRHHPNPLMREQKIDNLQMCLKFLLEMGFPVKGIHAEDIIDGNLPLIVAICQSLMHHVKKSFSNDNQGSQFYKRERTQRVTSLRQDDLEVLDWVGKVVHRNITDYTSLYDGMILCDLVNSVHNRAIDTNELSNLSPIQCLEVAFSTAKTHLGISRGTIDLMKLANGQEDHKLKSYLQHFRMIHQHEAKRKLRNTILGTEQKEENSMYWDESYDNLGSLSSSKIDRGNVSRRQSETLRPKRSVSDAHLNLTQTLQRDPRSASTRNTMRHSLSSEHIYPNGSQITQESISYSRPSKTEHSYRSSQSNKSKQRPQTADTSTNATVSVTRSKPIFEGQRPGSSDSISRTNDRSSVSNGTSTSRYSYPTTTVERSYSSDIPLPVTIYRTSSRTSIHSTSSRSSLDRSSNMDDHHVTLNHLANVGPMSLPPHMLSVDNDMVKSRSNSGSETLAQCVEDLNERLKELALSIDEEKEELIQQLLSLISNERKKHEILEKRHTQLLKKANYVMQHYDGCLIDIAKDVAYIKGEIQTLRHQVSSVNVLKEELSSVSSQLKELKEQVSAATGQQVHQHQQQPSSLELPSSQSLLQITNNLIPVSTTSITNVTSTTSTTITTTTDKSKRHLFSRKV